MRPSLPSPARRDNRRLRGLRRWARNPRNLRLKSPLFVVVIVLVASGQVAEPLSGTWVLNFAESTFLSGPPQYKRVITRIEPWNDGLKVVYDMVGVRGGVTHWEWTGRIDGKDYPLQGVEDVITYAYK